VAQQFQLSGLMQFDILDSNLETQPMDNQSEASVSEILDTQTEMSESDGDERSTTCPNFIEAYALGDKLGVGSFSQVRAVSEAHAAQVDDGSNVSLSPRQRLAVKVLDLRKNRREFAALGKVAEENIDERKRFHAEWEVRLWQRACSSDCPHLVQLHDVYWEPSCCFLVMERCDASLQQFLLQRTSALNEAFLAGVFQQVLRALSALHKVQVVHCDLKPENVFVQDGCVKLGDFGLSAICDGDDELLTAIVGTAPFMSPEMLCEAGFDSKTDIWSMGVLMYAILYGQFPYVADEHGSGPMKAAIRDGRQLPSFRPRRGLSEGPSGQLESLVRCALTRSPEQRPCADEMLASDYWQSFQSRCAEGCGGPSFHLMLQCAIKAGAFGNPQKKHSRLRRNSTDLLLDTLTACRKSPSESEGASSDAVTTSYFMSPTASLSKVLSIVGWHL